MKEPNGKNLENFLLQSLLQTVGELGLPYWAKTTIAVSVGVTPLFRVLAPLIGLTVVLNFIARLLGF